MIVHKRDGIHRVRLHERIVENRTEIEGSAGFGSRLEFIMKRHVKQIDPVIHRIQKVSTVLKLGIPKLPTM